MAANSNMLTKTSGLLNKYNQELPKQTFTNLNNANQQFTNNNKTTINSNQINMNYAKATKSTQNIFPNKNQGIIMNANDEIQTEEYVIAIGSLIGPEKITHYSKLSNNRINIYLNNKETTEELLKNHKTIKINNIEITIRHLITPNKRIVISNACPSIPHQLVEEELIKNGLKLTSQMNFVRAGLQHKGYEHILSFRRQIYIEDNEKTKIPETLLINHDDTQYRIFITDESYFCAFCKKFGHKDVKCKYQIRQTEQIENIPEEQNTNEIPYEKSIVPGNDTKKTPQKLEERPKVPKTHEKTSTDDKELYNKETSNLKRTATSSAGSTESLIENNHTDNEETQKTANTSEQVEKHIPIKTKSKKSRKSLSPGTPIEDWLKPAKQLFKSPNAVLNYEQFLNFFETAYNNKDPLAIAREYTDNIEGLLIMMDELYNFTNNRSAKIRLKKTMNKIQKKLEDKISSEEDKDEKSKDKNTAMEL